MLPSSPGSLAIPFGSSPVFPEKGVGLTNASFHVVAAAAIDMVVVVVVVVAVAVVE